MIYPSTVGNRDVQPSAQDNCGAFTSLPALNVCPFGCQAQGILPGPALALSMSLTWVSQLEEVRRAAFMSTCVGPRDPPGTLTPLSQCLSSNPGRLQHPAPGACWWSLPSGFQPWTEFLAQLPANQQVGDVFPSVSLSVANSQKI